MDAGKLNVFARLAAFQFAYLYEDFLQEHSGYENAPNSNDLYEFMLERLKQDELGENIVSPMEKEDSSTCEILQFYSKSKDGTELGPDIVPHWRKILSNFWMVTVSHEGDKFPSVEHFFQASKFKCSNKPEYFADFTVNGKYGNVDALTAKRKGSKAGFNSMGAILDVDKWNMCRIDIMRDFIQSRYEQDDVFRQILNECRDRGVTLLHFERSGQKSFWGGSVSRNDGNILGKNHLGKIMMEIARGRSS